MKYDYKCLICNTVFEEERSIEDCEGDNVVCPSCGKKGVKKLISKISIGGNDCGGNCSSCGCCSH